MALLHRFDCLLPPALLFGCLLSVPAIAVELHVGGPPGTYSSIQAALDDALLETSDVTIKLATAGSPYEENIFLAVPSTWTHALTISGGWNATFDVQSLDPTSTTIDGRNLDHTLNIDQDAGSVHLSNVTLTRGRTTGAQGPGLLAHVDDASLTLSGIVVSNSAIEGAFGVEGGGLSLILTDASEAVLEDSVITGNLAQTSGSSASGGGAAFNLSGTSSLTVRGNLFDDNAAGTTAGNPGDLSTGCGLRISMFDTATAVFEDNLISANRCTGSGLAFGTGASLGVGSSLTAGHPTMTIRRLQVKENLNQKASSNDADQLDVLVYDADFLLTDSLVVDGDQRGAVFDAFDANAVVRVTNLTVAGNASRGLRFEGNSAANSSLANTIVFGNSPDASIVGSLTESNNLLGTDPHFFGGGNYSLRSTSPALDFGSGSAPGGIGPTDVEGDARTQGIAIDAGAYEGSCAACIFADGFESGNAMTWSP